MVLVTWTDSVSDSRWQTLEHARGSVLKVCQSVGWVVAENDEALVICSSQSSYNDGSDLHVAEVWTIPAAVIESVRELG